MLTPEQAGRSVLELVTSDQPGPWRLPAHRPRPDPGNGLIEPGAQGQALGGADDAGAPAGMFVGVGRVGGVRAVGAGEHAGELGDGLPPGGQGDDQEDQVGGVEVVVEEAVALGGGESLDLALVVGSAVDLVGRGSAARPSHCNSRASSGWAAW